YGPYGRLTPVECGVLIDERLDPRDISATVMHLAVRGFITITETKGLFGAPNFTLTRTGADEQDLFPFESMLMNVLFSGSSSVSLSDLRKDTSFAGHMSAFQTAVYERTV